MKDAIRKVNSLEGKLVDRMKEVEKKVDRWAQSTFQEMSVEKMTLTRVKELVKEGEKFLVTVGFITKMLHIRDVYLTHDNRLEILLERHRETSRGLFR